MKVRGAAFGPVSADDLDRYRSSMPTYDHVGSTLQTADAFDGNRYEDRVSLGNAEGAFAAARSALRSWVPQRSIGASVRPASVLPEFGETVVLLLGISHLRLAVPTRVVATIDEPDEYAYAYGTLPGHPERGEELFLIRRHTNDEVVLTIRVDAHPTPALRPAGGIVRTLQRAALGRYLTSVADHVRIPP